MHETAKRLLEIGIEQGAKDFTEIAKRFGGSDQSATNWKSRGVPARVIIEAAKEYGASPGYLLSGLPPKYLPPSTSTEARQPVPPGDNRLPIRRALFKLSAGVCGYEVEYENGESEPIYMGKRWFDQHHYRADKLIAVKVNGRSMEPSLYDGDLVVINTEDSVLKDGDVFAANYEGELVIKRLKRDGGNWYLSSDNPDKVRFGDKLCQDGCGLIGKIVYKQSEHI